MRNRLMKLPRSMSSPLIFCALMILSASSNNVGMNLNAIVIIIANSCAGTPITFNGVNNFSVASVSFNGEVVNVNNDDAAIINIKRKLIRDPSRKPSSVTLNIHARNSTSPSWLTKWITNVNKMIHRKGLIACNTAVNLIFEIPISNATITVKKIYSTGSSAEKIIANNTKSAKIFVLGSSPCNAESPGKYCPNVIS